MIFSQLKKKMVILPRINFMENQGIFLAEIPVPLCVPL